MDKDLISLLHVGNNTPETQRLALSKAHGFSTIFWDTASGDPVTSLKEMGLGNLSPLDLVFIDGSSTRVKAPDAISSAREWIPLFDHLPVRPAFFLGVNPLPEWEVRRALLDAGYDEVMRWPLSPGELAYRARIYLEKKNLEQQHYVQNQTLEKAFAYLDRFKLQLKLTQKELAREKNSLNTALKQIHHLTHERSLMKKAMVRIKASLGRNVKEFEGLLSTLIQTRVETNRGHGDRVAHIATFIAKQFDFDGKKLDDLGKAAMLHEIGLLFMSGQALTKDKSQLTHHEKNIWIQYPVKGADLLNECPGFEGCAGLIRSLNEHSDGTGFPLGLKRKHIPLGSRILAGADELDMLKENPEVRSLEALLAGLETLAGSRLDPLIVGWLEKYAVLHMGSNTYQVRGVGVEQLKPGMRLGTALFTSGGTKLFSADTLLTQEYIDKIIQYNREYPVDEIIYIKA